jgi:hypothetical protein
MAPLVWQCQGRLARELICEMATSPGSWGFRCWGEVPPLPGQSRMDFDVLYGVAGKTIRKLGHFSIGSYFGNHAALLNGIGDQRTWLS